MARTISCSLLAATSLFLISIVRLLYGFDYLHGQTTDSDSVLFWLWWVLFCLSLHGVFNLVEASSDGRHGKKLIQWFALIALVYGIAMTPFWLHQQNFLSVMVWGWAKHVVTFLWSVVAATCLWFIALSVKDMSRVSVPLSRILAAALFYLALFQLFYFAERLLLVTEFICSICIVSIFLMHQRGSRMSESRSEKLYKGILLVVPVIFVAVYSQPIIRMVENSSAFVADVVFGDDGFEVRQVETPLQVVNTETYLLNHAELVSITPVARYAWFSDIHHGLIVTSTKIYRTEDGGRHWRWISDLDYEPAGLSVSEDGQRMAITLNDRNVVYISKDGGDSWQLIDMTEKLKHARGDTFDTDDLWNRSSQITLEPQTGYGQLVFDCEHWFTQDFASTWQHVRYNKENGEALCPADDHDSVQQDQLKVIARWGVVWERADRQSNFEEVCQDMRRDDAVSFAGIDNCKADELDENAVAIDEVKRDILDDSILDVTGTIPFIQHANAIYWLVDDGFLAIRSEQEKHWKILSNTHLDRDTFSVTADKAFSVNNTGIWYTLDAGKIWRPIGVESPTQYHWSRSDKKLYVWVAKSLLSIRFDDTTPTIASLLDLNEQETVYAEKIGGSEDGEVLWVFLDEKKLISQDRGKNWQVIDLDTSERVLLDIDCESKELCYALTGSGLLNIGELNLNNVDRIDSQQPLSLTKKESEYEAYYQHIKLLTDTIMVANEDYSSLYIQHRDGRADKRYQVSMGENSSFWHLAWTDDGDIGYGEKSDNQLYLVDVENERWEVLTFSGWEYTNFLCLSESGNTLYVWASRDGLSALLVSEDFGHNWKAYSGQQQVVSCRFRDEQLILSTASEQLRYIWNHKHR